MRLNPEFRRYLWLELSAQRLIAMPVVLAAVLWLTWLASDEPLRRVGDVAQLLFLLLVMVWGVRLTATSVVNEVREATWDWQRMSAIRPWTMTWGKLFGSTIFVWYGGLICLAVYLAAMHLQVSSDEVAREATTTVLTALLGQTVALAASLLWLRRVDPGTRAAVMTPQVLGLAAGIGFLTVDWAAPEIGIFRHGGWYGLDIAADPFLLATLVVFLAWAILAAGRLMQAELQVRQRPWAWPAFTLFLMAYLQGFRRVVCVDCASSLAGDLLLPFLVALGLGYLALLIFPKRAVQLRALALAIRAGAWGRALRALPLWLVALAIALAVGLGFAAALLSLAPTSGTLSGPVVRDAALVALAILAFLLRDLFLVLLLNIGGRAWRGDTAAGIYLVVLHVIAPAILAATAGAQWSGLTTGFAGIGLLLAGPSVNLLQLPGGLGLEIDLSPGTLPEIALAAGLVQATLLLLLLWRRWAGFQAAFEKRLPARSEATA